MRYLKVFAFALFLAVAAGCGGDSNKPLTPLTEEQNRKVAEEDARVADEESGGTYGKQKKVGGKR